MAPNHLPRICTSMGSSATRMVWNGPVPTLPSTSWTDPAPPAHPTTGFGVAGMLPLEGGAGVAAGVLC
jgi:hypothetical protein